MAQFGWRSSGDTHDYDRTGLVDLQRELRADLGVELYIEPGTAIGFDSAILVGEVLDVTENGGLVGITDISPTCHMPDVIEAPYRLAMLGEGGDVSVRLGAPAVCRAILSAIILCRCAAKWPAHSVFGPGALYNGQNHDI